MLSRTSYRTACQPSGEKAWPSWNGTWIVSIRAVVALACACSMSARPCVREKTERGVGERASAGGSTATATVLEVAVDTEITVRSDIARRAREHPAEAADRRRDKRRALVTENGRKRQATSGGDEMERKRTL